LLDFRHYPCNGDDDDADAKLARFGHDYFFTEPTPLPNDSDYDDTFYDCLAVDSTPMALAARQRRGFSLKKNFSHFVLEYSDTSIQQHCVGL
jgi:hypothetical protein